MTREFKSLRLRQHRPCSLARRLLVTLSANHAQRSARLVSHRQHGGCGLLGPSSADWGTGAGAVNVNFSMEETTVESTFQEANRRLTVWNKLVHTRFDGGVLQREGEAVAFSGYLGASQF